MSRKQDEHPEFANSSGCRRTEKETGTSVDKKFVTGKSTFSSLTTAGWN